MTHAFTFWHDFGRLMTQRPILLWKNTTLTDTREEDEIIEKSQIHSLSRGDKLLCGRSLREVKKYGVNAQAQVVPDT